MPTRLNPYLSFRDNAHEAMEFYESVFGGELHVNTFADFQAPNGIVLMAADTPNRMEWQPGSSISISLSGDDDPLLRGYYDTLSADGTVTMPLEKAPWGDVFGMCTDRFGINWLVNIDMQQGTAS